MWLPAWAIGPLTFGAPAVLWGAAAAAAPILFHLLLRPKPRRQPFPAVRFIVQSRRVADRANRLRRLLLLAMRVLAIVLVAMLLAQPRLRAARWATVGGPASVAICIDDSASMSYRYQGRTRLDVAKEWAGALVEDRSRFGDGSEFVVLTSRPISPLEPRSATAFTTSRHAAGREISLISEGFHDAPVGSMLRRADEMLATARHPRREIYLFHDATIRGWRDVADPPRPPTSNAAVFCVDVGVDENLNNTLLIANAPEHAVSAGAPIRLDVVIRRGGGPANIGVQVRVDGQLRWRGQPGSTTLNTETAPALPEQTAAIPITLAPLEPGLHRIEVELTPSDALAADNVRFVGVDVAEPPPVVLVSDDYASDSIGSLVAAMLAPASLPEERQRVRLRRMKTGEADAAEWRGLRCVVIADAGSLSRHAWETLTSYARNGGTVAVILGSAARPEGYAAADLLPAMPVASVRPPEPTRLAATDLRHTLLAPFAAQGIDSLNDRAVYQFWRITDPAPEATVVAPFASGQPAIVTRPVGSGRSILLAFSPQRDWSEFAAQAAPMIVLLHRIMEGAGQGTSRKLNAFAGAACTASLPSDVTGEVKLIRTSTSAVSDSAKVTLPGSPGHVEIPTDQPGHVVLSTPKPAGSPLVLCSINVAPEESDLRRMPPNAVTERFPRGTAIGARSPDDLARMQRRQRVGIDAVVPVALLLLGLLIAETAFANRCYKQPKALPS